ncbi:propanediol dehydratase medium subunit [Desulfatibacillum alkenivorans DSM 16219]|jgi:propanediol dehydratase medium subunit|uniref:Propanediol dehydratase medium subunit n=1 Tax=Desulfatibacillum alkenivorans DSM 16219 TaxID=1121393 RepID=A0A1M6YU36_9BACT|nr:propanediol/glycerol family dehydratase medium subunit [Desulfatibacillum alkenivorans]SHL21786.1 propanediol dehydratase medium subunit [Desulfatibacillum alkenivorans DSM 16219]
MKLTEEMLRQIITEVVGQMAGGAAAPASAAAVDTDKPLDFIEKGPAQAGSNPKEVVIAVPPGFGTTPTKTIIDIPHSVVLAEVAAGIEEEGLTARFVRNYQTADVAFLAHSAAQLSGSGVGIGILSRGTSVIHQKDLAPLQNLELFPQAPLVEAETFRAIGKNAAKYAKGENPNPVPVKNDPMARPRYQGLAALLHNKEVQFLDPQKKILEVVQG